MLVIAFPAPVMGTNCYVIAPAPGDEAVIVDPGIGVLPQLSEVLRSHRLRPAAVMLTHGHVDHVHSVTPVCGAHDVPALIHGEDRYRLLDPLAGLDASLLTMLEQQFGSRDRWQPPSDVVEIRDAQSLTLAGLELTVQHAPGHTEGSVMVGLEGVPEGLPPGADVSRTVLAGDVLFAGSIGRTDLAGGDPAAMSRTLRDVVLPLADDTLVLPGHGPATTMAAERRSNPYLN